MEWGVAMLRLWLLIVACATTASFARWGHASPTDHASASEAIEEVVITATRRQVALSDAPLSVSVLSEEDLEETGVRLFRDYLSSIPGVAFSDVGQADPKITVRGISTDIFSEVRDLTAVYLDETPITNPGTHLVVQSALNPYLVDIRQVELLRGPQGTLFGANSMGGTLRILTNRPDPARFESVGEVSISSIEHGDSTYAVNGILNLPLETDSAVRLVGYYDRFGGSLDNIGTGQNDVDGAETKGTRISGATALSERLSLDVSMSLQDRRTDGFGQANIALPNYRQTTNVEEYWDDEWRVYNAVTTWDVNGAAELMSSTSYQDRRWDGVGDVSGLLAFFGVTDSIVAFAHQSQELDEFTQELRLTSTTTDAPIDWLLGAFFVDRDLSWRQSFPAPGFDAATGGSAAAAGNPDNLQNGETDFDHRHVALYGETSVALGDQVRVTFGGRSFRFEESSRLDNVGILSGGSLRATNHYDESGFVPKVTMSWSPTPSHLAYATASKGFRPGGPNYTPVPLPLCQESLQSIGLSAAPTDYESDSLWNFEVGARTSLLDGRVRASGSVYRIDWSDVQILAFLSCGTAFTSNAAEARSDGAELELVLRPLDALTLELSGSYVDARVTNDVRVLNVEDGEVLPGVPEWTVQVSATWHFELPGIEAFARGDYRYVDDTAGTFVPEGAPRLTAPSYALLDLRIGGSRGDWSATFFLTNVFDKHGIVNRVDDFGLHPGGDWENVVQPRTFGVIVRAQLDGRE